MDECTVDYQLENFNSVLEELCRPLVEGLVARAIKELNPKDRDVFVFDVLYAAQFAIEQAILATEICCDIEKFVNLHWSAMSTETRNLVANVAKLAEIAREEKGLAAFDRSAIA